MDATPVQPAFKAHSIFAREDGGPETRRIHLVRLYRMKGDVEYRHPRDFLAADLPSWERVYQLFGGGTYKARGLDERCRFSTGDTDWVTFEGQPKPFGPPPGPKLKAAGSPPAADAADAGTAPPPTSSDSSALAAAITGLATVIGNAIVAFANRPDPPPPPPPPPRDNSVMVALIQSQSNLVTALLNKPPEDDSLLLAMLSAQTELVKAMLAQKPTQESPLQIAEALARMKKHNRAPASSVSEMVETFKALKEIMGPRGDGGKLEVTEIVNGMATLAQIDAKGSSKVPPKPPEPERKPRLMFRDPQLGLIEVHEPTPELLESLANQPAPAAAPRPQTAHPTAAPPLAQPTSLPASTPPPAVAAPVTATVAPPAQQTPSQPMTVEPTPVDPDELAALARKLRNLRPEDAERLASLLREPPAAPVVNGQRESVSAGPRMLSLGGVMFEQVDEPKAILSNDDPNSGAGMDSLLQAHQLCWGPARGAA